VCRSICYYYALRYWCVGAGLNRTSLSGSAAAAVAAVAGGINQPVSVMHCNGCRSMHRSLIVLCVFYSDVHRQVATSNAVLLHPQSSERAGAAAAKTKRWDKRKSKETKRGVKRERVTFFAAQYELDEPLLKQFVMFMAAECADKTSTDFIEVSSRDRRARHTRVLHMV